MQEEWLERGELHHAVYGVHLLAWLLLALALLSHLGRVLKLGGLPLARSMFSATIRPGDRPGDWWRQLRRGLP